MSPAGLCVCRPVNSWPLSEERFGSVAFEETAQALLRLLLLRCTSTYQYVGIQLAPRWCLCFFCVRVFDRKNRLDHRCPNSNTNAIAPQQRPAPPPLFFEKKCYRNHKP